VVALVALDVLQVLDEQALERARPGACAPRPGGLPKRSSVDGRSSSFSTIRSRCWRLKQAMPIDGGSRAEQVAHDLDDFRRLGLVLPLVVDAVGAVEDQRRVAGGLFDGWPGSPAGGEP
jgi:hypothetical protein